MLTKGKKKAFFGASLIFCLVGLTEVIHAQCSINLQDVLSIAQRPNSISGFWQASAERYNRFVGDLKKDYTSSYNAYLSVKEKIKNACPNVDVDIRLLMEPEALERELSNGPDKLATIDDHVRFWNIFVGFNQKLREAFNNANIRLFEGMKKCPNAPASPPSSRIRERQYVDLAYDDLRWARLVQDAADELKKGSRLDGFYRAQVADVKRCFENAKQACSSPNCPQTKQHFCSQLPDISNIVSMLESVSFLSDFSQSSVKALAANLEKAFGGLQSGHIEDVLRKYQELIGKCNRETPTSHPPAAQQRK